MNDKPAFRQVITISPTGAVSSLDRKSKGLDLKTLGEADVKRVSEIEWHEATKGSPRGWHIHFLRGHRAGVTLTLGEYRKYADRPGISPVINAPDGAADEIATFADYDPAVAVEVIILDDDRINGLYPKD